MSSCCTCCTSTVDGVTASCADPLSQVRVDDDGGLRLPRPGSCSTRCADPLPDGVAEAVSPEAAGLALRGVRRWCLRMELFFCLRVTRGVRRWCLVDDGKHVGHRHDRSRSRRCRRPTAEVFQLAEGLTWTPTYPRSLRVRRWCLEGKLRVRRTAGWCLVRNRHSVTRTLHGCWSGWWCLHESCFALALRRRARLALALSGRLRCFSSRRRSSRHRSLGSPAQRARDHTPSTSPSR